VKKSLGKIVMAVTFAAILGVIGRMDYQDQADNAALSKEIRSLSMHDHKKNRPIPLEALCLASSPVSQHCIK
jgi:hypothetical protein